jgi:hypothetical protein
VTGSEENGAHSFHSHTVERIKRMVCRVPTASKVKASLKEQRGSKGRQHTKPYRKFQASNTCRRLFTRTSQKSNFAGFDEKTTSGKGLTSRTRNPRDANSKIY